MDPRRNMLRHIRKKKGGRRWAIDFGQTTGWAGGFISIGSNGAGESVACRSGKILRHHRVACDWSKEETDYLARDWIDRQAHLETAAISEDGGSLNGVSMLARECYAKEPINPGLARRRLATKPIRHSPANSMA